MKVRLSNWKAKTSAATLLLGLFAIPSAGAQADNVAIVSRLEAVEPTEYQADAPSASPPPPADPVAGDPAAADNLDGLLDMADKDISQLGQVNVASSTIEGVSEVNPIVEGVSKKEETLAETPGIVDVITAQDIQEFGAKNLYEVLQWATSVYMTGSFLYPRNVASIRGNLTNHEDSHVLVLINGRPFRDVVSGGINFSIYTAFPIHMIERVEIIRGPGSVLYGTNAFSGVINVITKDPDQPTLYGSTLNGSYGWQSYSLAAGAGNETEGAYAGATYSRQKGWPFTATSEDPPGPAPATTETARWGEDNVGAFAMYRNGGATANLFVARATEEMLGSTALWPSGRLEATRVFCDLGYLLEINDWQSLQTNFTYNYNGLTFPVDVLVVPPPQAVVPAHSFLIEGTYRMELDESLNLLFGGFSDIHAGEIAGGPIPAVPPFTEVWYGLYAQLEYQTFDWLKLVGGMQANMPGEIKSGIVPRFGAIASLTDAWTAKFLYGQSFRSPYAIERSIDVPGVLIGNPNLEPEVMQTFDLQLAYRTEDIRLAATYFHSDFFNVITRSGFPQTYSNDGQIEFQGVELESRWEMSDHWRTVASTTYQDNVRDGVHNTTTVPNCMAKMGVAYHDGQGLNVGLFDSFFGDSTVSPTAARVNPDPQAYHLVSLNSTLDLDRRYHWHTGHSVQLQFLIQNLFDQRIDAVEFERERINSLPAGPGRTYYGGFTMQY